MKRILLFFLSLLAYTAAAQVSGGTGGSSTSSIFLKASTATTPASGYTQGIWRTGNVGIGSGATNATNTLHVKGTVRFEMNSIGSTSDSIISINVLGVLGKVSPNAYKVTILAAVQPIPTPTGNTTNLNTIFTATDGNKYFVDWAGNAIQLSSPTTNTLVNDGINTLTSTVNGVAAAAPIVNTHTSTYVPTSKTLYTEVNGVSDTTYIPSAEICEQIATLPNGTYTAGTKLVSSGTSAIPPTWIGYDFDAADLGCIGGDFATGYLHFVQYNNGASFLPAPVLLSDVAAINAYLSTTVVTDYNTVNAFPDNIAAGDIVYQYNVDGTGTLFFNPAFANAANTLFAYGDINGACNKSPAIIPTVHPAESCALVTLPTLCDQIAATPVGTYAAGMKVLAYGSGSAVPPTWVGYDFDIPTDFPPATDANDLYLHAFEHSAVYFYPPSITNPTTPVSATNVTAINSFLDASLIAAGFAAGDLIWVVNADNTVTIWANPAYPIVGSEFWAGIVTPDQYTNKFFPAIPTTHAPPVSGSCSLVELPTPTAGWELLGNAGTVNGTNFLGTTDNVPLEFRTNNVSMGLLGTNGEVRFGDGTNLASGQFSTISGGDGNISTGQSSAIGGGRSNLTDDSFSTIGGGVLNIANGIYSTISGGQQNATSGRYSTISGGTTNTAPSYGEWTGGLYNKPYAPASATSWVGTDYIFRVGNGQGVGLESDALTITKAGDVVIPALPSAAFLGTDVTGKLIPVTIPTPVTTNTLTNPVNTITSTVNGVVATAPAVNTNVLTYVPATTANPTGGNLTSTVNGIATTVNINPLNPTANKVATFNGDIDVTGTIDPTRVLFSNLAGVDSPTYNPSANGNNYSVRFEEGGHLNFQSDATTDILHLNNDGKVGVGTATPTSKLHVVGVSTVAGFDMLRDANYTATAAGAGVGITGSMEANNATFPIGTSGLFQSKRINSTVNKAGGLVTDNIYGVYNQLDASVSGTTGITRGYLGLFNISGTGTFGTTNGLYNLLNNTVSGSVGNISSGTFGLNNTAAGSTGTLTGIENTVTNSGATGTTGNVTGIATSVTQSKTNAPTSVTASSATSLFFSTLPTVTGTGSYSLMSVANTATGGGATTLYGNRSQMSQAGATVSQNIGMYSQNAMSGTAGASIWTGNRVDMTNTATNTATTIHGQSISFNLSNTATTNNLYGQLINITGGATVTNGYGVRIDGVIGTNRWGLYQSLATANNYLAGNTGIGAGVTTPLATLDLGGSVRNAARVVTATTTLLATDNIILAQNGGTNITITIPTTLQEVVITRSVGSTGTVTIVYAGGTIEALAGTVGATTSLAAIGAIGGGQRFRRDPVVTTQMDRVRQ